MVIFTMRIIITTKQVKENKHGSVFESNNNYYRNESMSQCIIAVTYLVYEGVQVNMYMRAFL